MRFPGRTLGLDEDALHPVPLFILKHRRAQLSRLTRTLKSPRPQRAVVPGSPRSAPNKGGRPGPGPGLRAPDPEPAARTHTPGHLPPRGALRRPSPLTSRGPASRESAENAALRQRTPRATDGWRPLPRAGRGSAGTRPGRGSSAGRRAPPAPGPAPGRSREPELPGLPSPPRWSHAAWGSRSAARPSRSLCACAERQALPFEPTTPRVFRTSQWQAGGGRGRGWRVGAELGRDKGTGEEERGNGGR